jgi:hypothetical protein
METLEHSPFEDDNCTECGASFAFHMTHPWVAYLKRNPNVPDWVFDNSVSPIMERPYDVEICYSYKMSMT